MPPPDRPKAPARSRFLAVGAVLLLLLAWLLLRAGGGSTAPSPGSDPSPGPNPSLDLPAAPSAATPPSSPTAAATARPLLVLDPAGHPVEGAVLSLVSTGLETEPPLPFGATGPDGRAPWPRGEFPLPGLLRAEAEGFAPGEAAVAIPDTAVILRLGIPFVLEGVVSARAGGAPVPHAEVRFEYDRHDSALGPLVASFAPLLSVTRTGPDGTFRFPSLSFPMQGLLSVRAAGFAEVRRPWTAAEGRRLRVELDPPLSLRVRLRGSDGRDLPGGAVALGWDSRSLHRGEGIFEGSWTPLRDLGDGTYGAEGLAPGWFLLAGGHAGYRPRTTSWVGLRQGAPALEVVLEPAEGVAGRVVDDATGSPLAGVRLRVLHLLPWESRPEVSTKESDRAAAALGPTVETRSGPDGTFSLGEAAPDPSLRLQAEAEGYWPARLPLAGAEGSGLEVRMKPLRTASLRGRAVDEGGLPVPGAAVRWEGILGRPPGVATAGADGRFLVAGIPDAASPVVLAPGRFPVPLGSPADWPGGDCGDVVLRARREVRGRVVDPAGDPVPFLVVGVYGEGGPAATPGRPMVPRVAASDGAGNLAIATLGAESLLLRPPPGAAWTGSLDIAPADLEPFVLVVTRAPGDEGTGVVCGVALDPAGASIPARLAAMVWVEGEDHPLEGVRPAFAGPDGTFTIERVPAGTYKVQVWGGDWIGETRGVVLPEGGRAEIRVTCTLLPAPDPDRPPGLLRVAPAGAAARALTGWATEGDRRSRPFRTRGEELEARVGDEGMRTLWIFDLAAGTAAVVPSVSSRDAQPLSVSLAPAGRWVLPPREDGRERWVVVRGPDGTIPWSNLETSLPGVPGEGYLLLLPPGDYEVTLSLGLARREPETRRIAVR